jgi:hypothetical protein
MRDAQVDCLAAILAEVNALGVYRPLQMFTTGATSQCILHFADRLSGVVLTVDERDGPRTLRSKVTQAAPIPDTRELNWHPRKPTSHAATIFCNHLAKLLQKIMASEKTNITCYYLL